MGSDSIDLYFKANYNYNGIYKRIDEKIIKGDLMNIAGTTRSIESDPKYYKC